MSYSGSAASITEHEGERGGSPSPVLQTTGSSEQLYGTSSSRESRNNSPLHRNHSPSLDRGTSSSSISSRRRRRREDKQPEELQHSLNSDSHSESNLPGSYRESAGEGSSDNESPNGRRVRTKIKSQPARSRTPSSSRHAAPSQGSRPPSYSTSETMGTTRIHSNSINSLQPEGSHGGQITQPRMSSQNTVPPYNLESFDSDMQNLVDGTVSEFDRFGPPPPPPKSSEYRQVTRSRGPSQSSSSAGQDIGLAQALLLAAPQTHQGGAYYPNTNMRYRASSSSSGPENALPSIPGASTPIPLSTIRQNTYVLPRWQSDAEVTFCPICKTQFSFFVRKHHCRKCGRVVCNACSPHRITIPYQFIVQPPTAEPTSATSSRPRPSLDASRAGSEFASLGGGERVRLCNPCVPDPNIAPPQTPSHEALRRPPHTNTHSRSASLASPNSSSVVIANFQRRPREPSSLRPGPNSSRDFATASTSQPHTSSIRTESEHHPRIEAPSIRSRSSTSAGTEQQHSQTHYQSLIERDDSRPLPRPPRIAEEDECPVCHLELPSTALSNSDTLREQHINRCIENAMNPTSPTQLAPVPAPPQTASSSGRPHAASSSSVVVPSPIANTPEARMAARERAHAAIVMGAASPPRPIRTTRMFPYKATEKDCIDDAECTICLEEFEVSEDMARLECLCRFHLRCIRQWFELHHGQCPVHQHDGGY